MLYELTWFEFNAIADGLKRNRHHDFNVMRHHASLTMMPHVDKKSRSALAPNKLIPLDGDKVIDTKPMSEAEAMKILQFFGRKLIDIEQI
jgi:hypothetical protein